MGLFFRKSVKFGPFRLNLSTSGIGLSAGVKGLRVGSGPRGNYVHMGAGGVYYRSRIGGQSQPARARSLSPTIPRSAPSGHLSEIESVASTHLVDSSVEGLLRELNEKRRAIQLWPFMAAIGAIASILLNNAVERSWIVWTLAAVALVVTIAVWRWDRSRKTTRIHFELNAHQESLLEAMHTAIAGLGRCAVIWSVAAEGSVEDSKRTAGANQITRRTRTTVRVRAPPRVETNVAVPCIGAGQQTLFFLPDFLLVYDKVGIGAVTYAALRVSHASVRFVESGPTPSDAEVVDRTWQYVNRSGGPDRRFRDNRELPVCLYEEISFTSDTGLNEKVMLSRSASGPVLESAIRALGTSH